MKKFFKFLYYYLKYHEQINAHYWFALKNNYAHNEEAGWYSRTDYWFKSE